MAEAEQVERSRRQQHDEITGVREKQQMMMAQLIQKIKFFAKEILGGSKNMMNHINNMAPVLVGQISNIAISAISVTLAPMIEIANQFIAASQRTISATTRTVQSAITRGLRYYTGARGESRIAQRLTFNSHNSSDRSDRSSMLSESDRRGSFVADLQVSREQSRQLASAGFYRTNDGLVKCAFCQGILTESMAALGLSPMRVHARQFGTCPFILGMDVGNEPESSDDEGVRLGVTCSEGATNQEATAEATTSEQLLALALSSSGGRGRLRGKAETAMLMSAEAPLSLPARAATVRGAQGERVMRSLELVERLASDLPVVDSRFARSCDRLETLRGVEFGEPLDRVADAGFYRSDASATVVCYSCGLRLRANASLGDAWVAHATWSPRCGHVLLERGAEYVRRVRDWGLAEAVAVAVAEVAVGDGRISEQRPPLMVLREGVSLGIRWRVELREFRSRIDAPAAMQIVRLGFSESEVRVATELRLVATGNDFLSSEVMLAAVVAQRDAIVARNVELEVFREQRLRDLRSSWPTEEPQDSPNSDARTCKICMDKQINVVLIDCGHLCCCSACSRSLQFCPICRSPIRGEAAVKFQ